MAIESFDKKKMGICTDLPLIAFESLAMAVSLGFSVTLREGEWFQRSGAIVVLISVSNIKSRAHPLNIKMWS